MIRRADGSWENNSQCYVGADCPKSRLAASRAASANGTNTRLAPACSRPATSSVSLGGYGDPARIAQTTQAVDKRLINMTVAQRAHDPPGVGKRQ